MGTDQKNWSELADRLEALALKLKLHFEQTHEGDAPELTIRLRQGVQDAFEAAGNVVKDEAVRGDVVEVGRLFASAVAGTLEKISAEVREAANRKS
jgi:hypothetical protein